MGKGRNEKMWASKLSIRPSNIVGRVSWVQSLGPLGRRGHMRDDSTEILFQSFLKEALVSSSDTGIDVHSLLFSIQHILCWTQGHPSSKKVPWRMVLERSCSDETNPPSPHHPPQNTKQNKNTHNQILSQKTKTSKRPTREEGEEEEEDSDGD